MWHVYGDTRTQWVKAEQLVAELVALEKKMLDHHRPLHGNPLQQRELLEQKFKEIRWASERHHDREWNDVPYSLRSGPPVLTSDKPKPRRPGDGPPVEEYRADPYPTGWRGDTNECVNVGTCGMWNLCGAEAEHMVSRLQLRPEYKDHRLAAARPILG
jgi:hypothetical protein